MIGGLILRWSVTMETGRCHKPSCHLVSPLHLLLMMMMMMMMKPYLNRVAFDPLPSGCLLVFSLSLSFHLKYF